MESALSYEKEEKIFFVVFRYSLERACEIKKFYVTVTQRRLRSEQKKHDHVQTCCFAKKIIIFLPLSLLSLPSLLRLPVVVIWKFWRHTFPLYFLLFSYESWQGPFSEQAGEIPQLPPTPPPPPPGSLQCRRILAGKSLFMFLIL